MNRSLEDLLAMLSGEASDDVRRVLLESSAQSESDIRRSLEGVERWALAKLGRRERPLNRPLAQPVEAPRMVRKAAITGLSSAVPRQATIGDFQAWCDGKASPEAVDRVRKALHDPSSDLLRLLSNAERWATRAFRNPEQ